MTVVGIDYSLTCPAVCVSNSKSYSDCYFYFLTDVKRHHGQAGNINGDPHDDYLTDQQRYENIASWVLHILEPFDKEETLVVIEDYSFGSKGKVFHLAENCGLLKYLLYKKDYHFFTIAPSAMKKYATGKGNANKQAMYDAFYGVTGVDLLSIYGGANRRLSSPVTDIVDSFFLARHLRDSISTNETENFNRGTNRTRTKEQ